MRSGTNAPRRAQRHRRVAFSVDGAQSNDFARNVESQYLLATLPVDPAGLDGAAANRGNRIESIARAKYVAARGKRADVIDQHVKVAQGALVQPFGLASLREGAGRTKVKVVAVRLLLFRIDRGKDGRAHASTAHRISAGDPALADRSGRRCQRGSTSQYYAARAKPASRPQFGCRGRRPARA